MVVPPSERHVSVSLKEGRFLHDWIVEQRCTASLEVGLAYGMSAVSMLLAHRQTGGRHTCLDPYQERDFQGRGLHNVEKLGLEGSLEFLPEVAHQALPRLLAKERRYDLAFIDGGHLFDQTVVSLFYADLMLNRNGAIVLHDAWMRSTQMAASFVRYNRDDYAEVSTPHPNLVVLRKRSDHDSRDWDHFREFYTLKGFFSQRLVKWAVRRGLARWFYR